MASRNEGTQPNTVRTTATTPATTTINQGQSQVEAGWENINQQNMTPESLAALQNLIQTLEAGGTPEQRASEARRRQTQSMVEQLLASVSTGAAMTDAQGLMALNLQQAMEKNMPAISKAIEGAGTSASSMQAVLSQQATRDASLAAGALGGQLAGQYAGERSNLASTLEALTRPNNQSTDALLQAFNIARGAVTNTQRRSGVLVIEVLQLLQILAQLLLPRGLELEQIL